MKLLVKVLSFGGQRIAEDWSILVGDEGATIGRANDNTLVLPDDREVSAHHAFIEREHDAFVLVDDSSNGTVVVGLDEPLERDSTELYDRDLLWIGGYELLVRDHAELQHEARSRSVLRRGHATRHRRTDTHAERPSDQSFDERADVDPEPHHGRDAARDADEQPPDDVEPEAEDVRGRSARSRSPDPEVDAPHAHRDETPGAAGALVDALLRGAGLRGAIERDPIDLMEDIGAFVRVVVEGLQAMLETRADILHDFGLRPTRYRGAGPRNVLGAFRTVDDALHSILLDDGDEYEDTRDAARSALDKLALHEQAVAAGYVACLRYVVEEFEPQIVLSWADENQGRMENAVIGKWGRYERYYRDRSRDLLKRNFQASGLAEIFQEEYARVAARDRHDP